MRIREAIEHVRHSLWFVPTASVLLDDGAIRGQRAVA